MIANSIAFEQQYFDGTGVQFAVRYNGNNPFGEIELEHVHKVDFPIDQLDWIIAGLQRIRDELTKNASPAPTG